MGWFDGSFFAFDLQVLFTVFGLGVGGGQSGDQRKQRVIYQLAVPVEASHVPYLEPAMHRCLFGPGPPHTPGLFPNHHVDSSSVSRDGFKRCLFLSTDTGSSEMMCLPVAQLHSRAESLVAKFEQGDGRNDMDEAIVLEREALGLCPPGHPERYVSLNRLGGHLNNRYEQLGAITDIEEAIVLARDALMLCPPGHSDRSQSLNNLSLYLFTRYNQLGGMEDLNEAIVLARDSLACSTAGHPVHSVSLTNLSQYLSSRYQQLGAMEYLNEAIALARDGLALSTAGHPLRSKFSNDLSIYLSTRYQQLGVMEDLNEAIVLARDTLGLSAAGHPDRSKFLNNLSFSLSTRYNQLGGMKDLNEAIVLARDSLACSTAGHPVHSVSLTNLSQYLSSRYQQLGAMEDLNEAIALARDGLALSTAGHPLRSKFSNNLSICLSTRYHQLGVMEDLNDAIVLARDTLGLSAAGHPDRSKFLNNLSDYLLSRYSQLRTMDDLDEAIVLARDGLALCPPVHPDRPMSSNNLAACLSARYNQLGVMHDLDEAIVLARDALALCALGHPYHSLTLSNLAVRLFARYKRLGALEDLDEAIVLSRDALELRQLGHPYWSMSLEDLAWYLCTRFTRSSQLKDKEELFSLYAQLAHLPSMMSSTNLAAAKAWIRAAENFHHPTTLLAYQTYLRLLTHHVATLPPLPQHRTLLKGITSSLAMDTFSACLRNCSPKNAVELLEQGRGVFWSQLTRLRSPLDDVIASGQAGEMLADEFTRHALLVQTALGSPGAGQHDEVYRLNVELQRVVTRIRELAGLSRFLLPPLFSDLQQAACEGPVIIVNASEYGCDALIVLIDRNPIHIPLSITKEGVRELSSTLSTLTVRAKSMDVTRGLAILLRELWDEVVSPIVHFLQTVHPIRSRIWWCPTAEFSLLPLHAAGPYRRGQRNLANLYISSYTPTLTALIHARRHDHPHSVSEGKQFIGIGQATAKGANELVSVGTELANIEQRIGGLAIFTHIEGQESCIARVTEELSKNEWVHFACHGIPNRKQPFESAFALHDGHFTVERIIRCELENAEFAYLSACHTTVGDDESPDEVIHLASAMQFAGFRSVIGTMWAVDDAETNKITSVFYDNMIDASGRLDYTRAALALNRTMKKLVDIVPFDQRILYIHLGA